MNRYYTGIGSRQTPPEILEIMTAIAQIMRERGDILRSGHAVGADRAFEEGAVDKADIYLPWATFGIKPYKHDPGAPVQGRAITLPRKILFQNYALLEAHEIRDRRGGEIATDAVKLLHGRNYAQVMGHEMDAPRSQCVICWTPTGLTGWKDYNRTQPQGGTATAILLADLYHIPVFNLARPEAREALDSWLDTTRI